MEAVANEGQPQKMHVEDKDLIMEERQFWQGINLDAEARGARSSARRSWALAHRSTLSVRAQQVVSCCLGSLVAYGPQDPST